MLHIYLCFGKLLHHLCACEWLVVLDELLDLFDIRPEMVHASSLTTFDGHQLDTGGL